MAVGEQEILLRKVVVEVTQPLSLHLRQMFVIYTVIPQEDTQKSYSSEPVSGMSFLILVAFLYSLCLLTPRHPLLRNYWVQVK